MASNVLDFYRKFQSGGAMVQTGRIISVGSTSCVVEVNGRNLSLVIMDSVTGLAVGKNVACLLQGGTGFIAGTISNANCGGGTDAQGKALPTSSKPTPTRQNVKYTLHPRQCHTVTNAVGSSDYYQNSRNGRILESGANNIYTAWSFFYYNAKTLKQLAANKSLVITSAQISVSGAGTYLLKRHNLAEMPKGTILYGNYDKLTTSPTASIDTSVSKQVTVDGGFSPGNNISIRVAENIKTQWFDIPVSWVQYWMTNKGGGIAVVNSELVGNNKISNVQGVPNGISIKITGYIQN